MTGKHHTDGGTGDRSQPSPGLTCEIGDDEPPSEAVVRAVAALTGTPPLDLDPLYSVVDPEYLDEFLDRIRGRGTRREASIQFTYAGCAVVVTTEEVRVREID